MSKRCELQKEYFKEFGNYKGKGKYSDHYVNWLESRVLTDKDSNKRVIEELEKLGAELYKKEGTDSYVLRCLIHDKKEELKQ